MGFSERQNLLDRGLHPAAMTGTIIHISTKNSISQNLDRGYACPPYKGTTGQALYDLSRDRDDGIWGLTADC